MYGPAAYLTDLLRFSEQNIAKKNNIKSVNQLFNRRPDLLDLKLDCDNSHQTKPFTDIVNQVLESRLMVEKGGTTTSSPSDTIYNPLVSSDSLFITTYDTSMDMTGATVEDRKDTLYKKAAEEATPTQLPVHLLQQEIRATVEEMGTSTSEILQLLTSNEDAIEREALGLTPEQIDIISSPSDSVKKMYGMTFGQITNHTDPIAAFTQTLGISFNQFVELTEQGLSKEEIDQKAQRKLFINSTGENDYVHIYGVGENTELKGLTKKRMNRIYRFVRLAEVLNWTYADLDHLLRALGRTILGGDLDNEVITKASKIKHICNEFDLTVEEACALFGFYDNFRFGKNKSNLYNLQFNRAFVENGQKEWVWDSNIKLNLKSPKAEILTRLQAAFTQDGESVLAIAHFLSGGSTSLNLSVKNLGQMNAISSSAKMAGFSVKLVIEVLKLMNISVIKTIDDWENVQRTIEWIRRTGVNMESLQTMVLGATSKLPWNTKKLSQFEQNLTKETTKLKTEKSIELNIELKKVKLTDEEKSTLLFNQLSILLQVDSSMLSAILEMADESKIHTYKDETKRKKLLSKIYPYLVLSKAFSWNDTILKGLASSKNPDIQSLFSSLSINNLQKLFIYANLPYQKETAEQFVELLDASSTKITEGIAKLLGVDKRNLSICAEGFKWKNKELILAENFDQLIRFFELASQLKCNASDLLVLKALQLNPDIIIGDYDRWEHLKDIANRWRALLKASRNEKAWKATQQKLKKKKSEQQRKLLLNQALWNLKISGVDDFKTTSDIYDYLLIDVEMGSCAEISTIKEAILAVQLYIQRCQTNLETEVDPATIDDKQWEWMKTYRIWEANRKVFLYPENYIEPEWRDNKTDLFKQLEDDLLQGELTDDYIKTNLNKYLEGLETIATLETSGAYFNHDTGEITQIGKTQTEPRSFYKRVFNTWNQSWSPWKKLDIVINSSHVNPVIAFNKLFLFWMEITIDSKNELKWDVRIKYAFQKVNGDWSQAQTLDNIKDFHDFDSNIHLHGPMDYYDKKIKLVSNKLDDLKKEIDPTSHGNDPEIKKLEKQLKSFERKRKEAYETAIKRAKTNRAWEMQKHGDYFYQVFAEFDPKENDILVTLGDTFFSYIIDKDLVSRKIESVEIKDRKRDHWLSIFLNDNDVAESKSFNHQLKKRSSHYKSLYRQIYGAHSSHKRTSKTIFKGSGNDSRLIPVIGHSPTTMGMFFFESNSEQYLIIRWPLSYSHKKVYLANSKTAREINSKMQKLGMGANWYFSAQKKLSNSVPLKKAKPMQEGIHFTPTNEFAGPMATYYRELFFHIPFLIANRFNENQKFKEAQEWYHYIFNPLNSNKKLREGQNSWSSILLEQLDLKELSRLEQDKGSMAVYKNNPFQPHALARLRPAAYQRSIIMKYIDNLLDWADQLFARDSWESINEATMLYILAWRILGKRPEKRDGCKLAPATTYRKLQAKYKGNSIPDFIIQLENKVKAPHSGISYTYSQNPLENEITYLAGNSLEDVVLNTNTSFESDTVIHSYITENLMAFCIPENDDFIAYWDRIDDRLFKIRHCLNIDGVKRDLALFEPEIDPRLLVESLARGGSIGSAVSLISGPTTHFRFHYLLERARNFTSQLQQLGNSLLAVIERGDGEQLQQLGANHQIVLSRLTSSLKRHQIDETLEQTEALERSIEEMNLKINFINELIKENLSNYENNHLNKLETANTFQNISSGFSIASSVLFAIPQFTVFPPNQQWGGLNLGHASNAVGQLFSLGASQYTYEGNRASTVGGFDRRKKEWKHQLDSLKKSLEQLQSQKKAAEIRHQIAIKDLAIHEKSIEHQKEQYDFIRTKFSSKELYQWMSNQLSTLYFQSYKIAHKLALQAEKAFRLEQNEKPTVSYISFGHWEDKRRGLLAGERLQLELAQLEQAYVQKDSRELEIEKVISLSQLTDKNGFGYISALQNLIHTGKCKFEFDELLFDLDYPGHCARKIRSISISIPAVMGPSETIKATLTQGKHAIRYKGDDQPTEQSFLKNQQVALSSGVNDSGMFELNFRGERYLAFEQTGAISEWELEMPHAANNFDFNRLSDVIIKLQYTAIPDESRRKVVLDQINGTNGFGAAKRLKKSGYNTYSLKHQNATNWFDFLNPVEEAKEHQLNFKLNREHFPYNLTKLKVKTIALVIDPQVSLKFTETSDLTTNSVASEITKGVISLGVDNASKFGDLQFVLKRADIPSKLRKKVNNQYQLDEEKLEDITLLIEYEGELIPWK
ncbi:MAG: neuraminidase-like domain-containing protein [Flavobacteriales bacterium]|nr:neuraminidase-like domain-containing protein [Flavobacteriales bacterium]